MATSDPTSLSPDQELTKKLADMTSSSGILVQDFQDVLGLPYVSSLRADATGAVSIQSVVTDFLQKYRNLQGMTIPVARDLLSYAHLQTIIVPTINAPSGVTLREYVVNNKILIARNKMRAATVKTETEAFRKDFSMQLDKLDKVLETLEKQIRDLDEKVRDKERKFDEAVTVAVLGAVFSGLLTAGFVASLLTTGGTLGALTGEYPVAFAAAAQGSIGAEALLSTTITLGAASIAGWTTTVIEAVQAADYRKAIGGLESAKRTAESARDGLKRVVPKLTDVEERLEDIVDVWSGIESNLNIILAEVEEWNENGIFNAETSQRTVDDWSQVEEEIKRYTTVVSGSGTLHAVHAIPQSMASTFSALPTLAVARKVEIAPLVAAKFSRTIAENAMDLLLTQTTAPSLHVCGHLSQYDTAYRTLTNLRLDYFGDVSLTQKQREISQALNEARRNVSEFAFELESLAEQSSSRLSKLTEGENIPKDIAQTTLKGIIDEISAREQSIAKEGGVAEKKNFTLQNEFASLNNDVIRRMGEIDAQISALERRRREIEHERDSRKWLWIVPVAGAINELVDAINDIQGDINDLRRKARGFVELREGLRIVSSNIEASLKQTTELSRRFSQILVKNNDSSTFVDVLDDIPYDSAAFKNLLRSSQLSWESLSQAVEDFLH